ncbi:MAG: SurA N-terminal domain-containing protein [Methylovulum sp.]|jgi:peptidyl-prolyl cis-trans isomerase D|nr:SurA N-terminal domain-containing protein [Methylovulum sp.]MCF7998391.1 SurA N-terminal domain-containing protein [Methylovulum sp.]
MLTTIREKSQGAFAWGILITICVPFALWGINNYMDNGQEAPVASVGDKDFFQRDINKAYEQYSQSLRGLGIDEQILKAQALQKLIKDEVLLQYVNANGLTVTDDNIRSFIQTLEYFQTDGNFDEKKYKALLSSQRLSSSEFISRIKNALVMEQFQHSIMDSAIATPFDIESFFKIQNQQRDIEYVTLPLKSPAEPLKEEEITAYYQQHQDLYQSPEQVSIDYLELSLADIANKITVTEDKLKAFYEEQKDQYTTPERRKISHILFTINDKTPANIALEKAQKAKQALVTKNFAALASEVSDDKMTAKTGGDLGLFTAGVMEKAFEDAAKTLQQGDVSEPVKSSFGYHLIKVTELVAGKTKPFDVVKDEVTKAYQKSQADNGFYEAGEKLAELSYQNPDNLQVAADALSISIKKSALFNKDKGDGITSEDKVRSAAFSEEVLQGNNSAPIELGTDRLIVLRMQEHKPAAPLELNLVKKAIQATLLSEKAKLIAVEKAKEIKSRLQSGEKLQALAAENKLEIKALKAVMRRNTEIPSQVLEALFKAAKPVADKSSIFSMTLPSGEPVVVSINKVTEGVMTDSDKKQMELAKKNIANAFGQAEFNAVLSSLEADADISVKESREKVQE